MLMWFADGLQNQLCGSCKGLGLQAYASLATFLTALFGSIPLAYVYGITLGGDLKGIWLGVFTGLFCQFLVYLFILIKKTDWK